jgi:DNA-binding NarL/FixJ family response regulator
MMRIAVLSKERLFLDAIAGLFERRGNFSVVLKESSPKALVAGAKPAHAQLLIVDSQHLEPDEVQFLLGARAIGEFVIALISSPNSNIDPTFVDAVISRDSSAEQVFELLNALQSKVPIQPMVKEQKRAYRKGNALTRREYEVAEFVAKGHSNRKISEVSGLREQSVKNIVSVIMRKLQCENRTQVALKLIHAEVEEPTE